MPIELDEERFLIGGHLPLGTALVEFVEGVGWYRKHPHVRPKLFHQGADDVLDGGVRRHADALRRDLLAGVLEVEAHDTVELQILKEKKKISAEESIIKQ